MKAPLTVVEPPVVLRSAVVRPRSGRSAAIFDLDGTLTRTDTLLPFLRRIAGTATLWRALAAAGLRDGRDAAKALVLQRLLGGRRMSDVDRTARAYAGTVVRSRLRKDSLARWNWHRAQGHRLIIASASPDVYVRHLGAILGADTVICTELSVVNGWLTGALQGRNCRGQEKARRIVEHLADRPAATVWAYADGDADTPLLQMADIAVRVSPYRRLPRTTT